MKDYYVDGEEKFGYFTTSFYDVFAWRMLKKLYNFTIDEVKNMSPASVLDIGAGPGRLSVMVAKQFPNAEFYTVDPSEYMVKVENKNFEAILGDTPYNIGLKLKNIVRIPDDTESMISRGLEMLKEMSGIKPKVYNRKGSEFEIVDPHLTEYPITKNWPKDGGRYITMPVVITKDPDTGTRNVGTYRMQVYDDETAGMHWHIHKGGAEHMDRYKKEGKIMDVAVAIGVDPLTFFSSIAPLPNGIDEFSFRGILAKKHLDLIKGETVNLEYPRSSQIVLEGYIDPSETRVEGPFGDHTGYYSLEEEFPVFHIKKIVQKLNPIYSTTIVGKLWHEDVNPEAAGKYPMTGNLI